jgi:tetratricopeptide (TPR) repeat protein
MFRLSRGFTWLIVGMLGLCSNPRADTLSAIPPLRIQELVEPVRLSGGDANSVIEAAAATFRLGKLDEAKQQLEAAVAKDKTLPPADALLALLCFSANQNQQGRMLLERAAAQGPEHPDIYLLFGQIALLEHRVTDAALAYEKAASITPPSGLNEEQKQNLSIVCTDGLARVAEARARWSEARDRLSSLLKLQPKDASVRQRLARAYFLLDQPNEAFEALKQACAAEPKLPPAGVTMGQLFAQKGNQKKAEEWMNYAVKADPKLAAPRLARAAWLIDQARSADAKADLDSLAKDGPPSDELRRLRGLLAYSMGEFAAAESDFQALLQSSPADLQVSNQLALCLAGQDDEAKRRRAMELAVVNARQYPNQPAILATLAWVEFQAGQVEQAEQTFRTATSKGQISSDAAFQYARILAARGNNNDARKLIETALNTPGLFAEREKAKAWLATLPTTKPEANP